MLIHIVIGTLVGFTLFFSVWRKKRREEFMGLMIAMSSLIELKDSYTEGHCARVRNRVFQIGKELGLRKSELEDITMAATLHDVGKVGIPDEVLKKQERLSSQEYEKIKNHPKLGSDAVRSIQRLRNVAKLIEHHHERYDGTGYPDGLKGEKIPLGSRVIAIIDSFDAMTSDRPYRMAFSREKALGILRDNKGTQFDPQIVDIFLGFASQEEMGRLDPVCGMPGDTNKSLSQEGITFYFCSDACLVEFCLNPSKYRDMLKVNGNFTMENKMLSQAENNDL